MSFHTFQIYFIVDIKHVLYDFKSYRSPDIHLTAQYVACLDECSMCTCKACVLMLDAYSIPAD